MRSAGLGATGLLLAALLAGCAPTASSSDVEVVRIVGDGESSARFDPAVVSVPIGTEVRWRNETSHSQSVIAADGSWGFEALQPGQTASQLFERAGAIVYTSTAGDDTLTGVVEVVEP